MVALAALLSSTLALWITLSSSAAAHEVLPAIGDMTATGDTLTFDIRLNLEGLIAGIDLATTADTNEAPQAATYDTLRALPPTALQTRFQDFWPQMAPRIQILVDGTALTPTLLDVTVTDTPTPDTPRTSTLRLQTTLPPGATLVQFGWAAPFGALVLRQMAVENPYDGFLPGGTLSDPIHLQGGDQAGQLETFLAYIPVGFDHIVPKGLDHILFVLGLYFLSTALRPLLLQVTAFTAAHTLTLAAAASGYVTLPATIVEPLIAASIVFVAVENILTDGTSRWRPFVVFCFGLLHGLGFASVLGEFGLPQNAFLPALIGFNIGVEFGQLAVITAAFAAVGFWFRGKSWYRQRIATPASAMIAVVGAYWFLQRVFFQS